eukprot:9503851-Pyramimonas_sp.AAC.13
MWTCQRTVRVRGGGGVYLVAGLVEADRDEEGRHVLRAAGAQHLVAAVLHQTELARVVHHAHLRVVEEEALLARPRPRHLRQLAALQVLRGSQRAGRRGARGRSVGCAREEGCKKGLSRVCGEYGSVADQFVYTASERLGYNTASSGLNGRFSSPALSRRP